jgi:ubiquinone/menaquinone biosynthesis C-methylase UbiE
MIERITRTAHNFGKRYRLRRFVFIKQLLDSLPKPIRILDVGGSQWFWEQMRYVDRQAVEIVIVNLEGYESTRPGFRGVYGDARDLSMFRDSEFDVAFSNSVIEHVGSWADQRAMAGRDNSSGGSIHSSDSEPWVPN